jgi:hypothetical protein
MNGCEMPIPDHNHIQSTYDKNKNIEIEGYFIYDVNLGSIR